MIWVLLAEHLKRSFYGTLQHVEREQVHSLVKPEGLELLGQHAKAIPDLRRICIGKGLPELLPYGVLLSSIEIAVVTKACRCW